MTRGRGEGKHFEVELHFDDGRRLKEYEAVSSPATEVECASTEVWVACENGKAFRIVIRDCLAPERHDDDAILSWLYLDGRHSDSGGFTQTQSRWTISSIALEREGEVATFPLTFAAINVVDDTATPDLDSEEAMEVGIIKIQLVEGKVVEDDEEDWEQKVVTELGTIRKGDAKAGSMIAQVPNTDLLDDFG